MIDESVTVFYLFILIVFLEIGLIVDMPGWNTCDVIRHSFLSKKLLSLLKSQIKKRKISDEKFEEKCERKIV